MGGRQVMRAAGAASVRLRSAGVLIQPAGLDALDEIARFQTSAWQVAYRGLLPPEYLESLSPAAAFLEWRGYFESGTRTVALARTADEVLGVVSWGPADFPADGVPDLELKSIYVASSAQGTGLAAELLETALSGKSAHLWMFEGNARADAFYRKLGFSPDGGRMLDEAAGAWELRYVR